MSARYIFNTSGDYVAFVLKGNLFSPDAEWLGVVLDDGRVYGTDGNHSGYLLDDDRIVRRTNDARQPRIPRPPRPMRPLRPLRPLRRLRMPRLPRTFEDIFEHGPATAKSLAPVPNLDALEGASIVATDGTFLGVISRNPYEPDSISNQYGMHGSRYANESIFNPYGPYGGEYSPMSPFNQYTSTPPQIVRNGRPIAVLTANQYLPSRQDPQDLLRWLNVES